MTIILILTMVEKAKSQDFVEISREGVRDARIETSWACEIKNKTNTNHRVYLHNRIIKNGGEVIYESTSDYFSVDAKSNKTFESGVVTENTVIINKIGKDRKVGLGSYQYQLELREVEDKTLLSTSQLTVSFDALGSAFEGVLPAQEISNKLISFRGDARLTYEYNPIVSGFTQLPNNQFVRLEATPSVTIKGIPISANILLSNEKFANTNLNQIDFQFDYYRYKEQLQSVLMEKIAVMEKMGDLGKIKDIASNYVREKYPAADKIKEEINSEKYQGIEEQLKSYGNVETLKKNIEENPDFQKYKKKAEGYAVKYLDSLQKMRSKIPSTDYEQMEWYLNTKQTYEGLKEKSKVYEKQKKLYDKYQNLKEKLKTIESVDYREIMNDPKSMEKYLTRVEGISKILKWANSIRQLGVGSSYPYYSDITLSGMRSNGFNVELNRGNYYAAFTRGTIDAMNYFGYPIGGVNRNLQGVRLGLGKIDDNHLFFNYIKIDDNLVNQDSTTARPQENMILGAEVQVNLLKKRVLIKSEIAQSFHTLDRTLSDVTNPELLKQGILKSFPFIKYNSTTHQDIAYNFEMNGQFNNGKTTFRGYYKYVGGGYVSLGVPFLLRDIKRYEGRLTHYIKDRKISLSLFVRNDVDNLLQNRLYTSYNTSIGGELGLNFKQLPKIKISFAPTKQNSIVNNAQSDTTAPFKANTNMLSLTVTHQYKLGKVQFVTQINGTGFLGQSTIQDYQTGNVSLQQNVQLGKKTGLSFFYAFYNQQFDTRQLRITESGANTGIEGYSQFSKKLTGNFGYTYSKSKTYPERQNVYVEGQLKVNKISSVRLRVNYAQQETNTIETPLYNTLNSGLGARAIVLFHW